MRTVLKSKRVSYGLVELVDGGTTWARYRIELNGRTAAPRKYQRI